MAERLEPDYRYGLRWYADSDADSGSHTDANANANAGSYTHADTDADCRSAETYLDRLLA
jgi:hypothetical protein